MIKIHNIIRQNNWKLHRIGEGKAFLGKTLNVLLSKYFNTDNTISKLSEQLLKNLVYLLVEKILHKNNYNS